MIARRIATIALPMLVLGAGCTSGQSGSVPVVATPAVAKTSSLQLAVGTATIGIAGGATTLGLNVVTTFRQANGNNATGVNTPTLTAPAGVNFGALLGNSNVLAGVTPAQLASFAAQVRAQPKGSFPQVATFAAGFGPYVGVFGYGLAADNLISSSDVAALNPLITDSPVCLGIATNYLASYYGNSPDLGSQLTPIGALAQNLPTNLVRSAELALPVPSGQSGGDSCSCPSTCAPPSSIFHDGSFPQQYFGAPPAWPSPQGYGNYSYFVGFPLGFTDFTATPVAGTYGLSVAFPTSADYHTFGTLTASAQLPAGAVAAPLPAFAQPKLTVATDGSASIAVTVPAGVREAVITVVTNDCDLTGSHRGMDHYALVTHQTGPQTLFLSASLGPPDALTGVPSHTFCTVSDVQAYNALAIANGTPPYQSFPTTTTLSAVGFDYLAYEASYPFNTSAAPAITNGDGHTGQTDITTSYPLTILSTVAVPAAGS